MLSLRVIALCLACYCVTQFINTNGLFEDGLTLLEIRTSFVGPSNAFADWTNASSHADPCRWQGVRCSPSPTLIRRVISVSLQNLGISGHLSPAIGRLDGLQSLDVSGNCLSRTIPWELSNCNNLRELNMANNFLRGVILLDTRNCSALTVLDLHSNNISGSILPELERGYGTKVSTEQDMYSFGVVLLELTAGKPPVVEENEKSVYLTMWVGQKLKSRGNIEEVMDADLKGDLLRRSEIEKVIEIGIGCSECCARKRPSMHGVVDMLRSARGEHRIIPSIFALAELK